MPPVPLTVEAKGAQDFASLVRAMKDAGRKDLQGELYRALNRAAKPARPIIQESARQRLPKRGGYNDLVAKDARVSVGKKSTGKDVGVRLVGRSRRDLRALERGILRWPVFPDAKNVPRREWIWKVRRIRPGFFTDALAEHLPRHVRDEILQAIEDMKKKLESSTR